MGVTHNDPFFLRIAIAKKQFFRGFTNFFSELVDCNTSYYYELNPITNFIGNQRKKKSGHGLWGKIWGKLGTML